MSQSIAFIDASLAQNDLALQNFDGQVYTIPFGEDGVKYMTEVLQQHQNLDAVHLFSHGSEAALMLGSTVLTPETLEENSELIESWQSALAPGADFLIYGCDVAAGENGLAFVEELSNLTGADVAASSNLTGTTAAADWQLEVTAGNISTSTEILTSAADKAFSLATINEANPGTIRVIDNDRGPFQDDEDDWDISRPGSYDDRFGGDDLDEFQNVSSSFVIRFDGHTFIGPGNFGGQGDDIGGGTIHVYWNVGNDNDTWYGSSEGARTDPYWNGGSYGSYHGIHVFGGNDTVYANGGNDIVYGGSGNDTLYGESGSDTLYGESGNDLLEGGDSNDTLEGGSGNDTLKGDDGNDTLKGGDNDDTLEGGDGSDLLEGNSGSDLLKGGSDGDTLHGGEGNNTIYAGISASADSSTSSHTITSGSGNDTIHGSQGRDVITVDGGTNEIDAYNGDNKVIGGSGQDTIRTGTGNDEIRARGGNDTVYAGSGNDIVTDDTSGGSSAGGNDIFYGEAGNDTLRGEGGDDQLYGGTGNDYLESGDGNDFLDGGSGDDILVYGNVANGDVGPHPDPNNNDAPTLNPNTRNLEEIKVADNSGWRSATGQATVDGGEGLDTLRIVGEYSDFDIATETLANGSMRFTVTDRNNASNQVVATNVEKIEFWNNYTVYPGNPTERELHNRNGIILPIRYDLEVLQHATEQLYGSKDDLKDNNKIGQVKVQLKDWLDPTKDYVIEGSEDEPGTKRDEYSRGNGLAIKYEIHVTGNFGPEETEFLSDKLRFKRINLETGRSTEADGDGLDYVTENFVVVQPGESSAIINILPIVDEIQEGLESVEVRIVSMDRVDKPDGGAGTSAYAYQEGFLYAGIEAANGQDYQAANNAENDIQDGINKGYVLMPVTQNGDRATVQITDSGLFEAGIRLVDEYGFQVTDEMLLQEGSTKVFVGLTSRPTETVTVTIAGQQYLFTSDRNTWNKTYEVTLNGTAGSTVTVDVSSADPFYNALTDPTFTLVTEQSTLQVPEPVALHLGDGNYIQLPNVTLNGDYAIEFWVKPDADGTLLQSNQGTLSLASGKLQGTSAFNFVDNSRNTLTTDSWHRVTLLSVNDQLEIFVDGNRAGSQTIGNNTSLVLQSVGAENNGLQGLVSNLRFWDQLIQDGDVYVGTLQAQYNIDEGSGTTLNNQAPVVSVGAATIAFNQTDALLWKAGVPLADPAFQEIVAEEATAFGLVNRNFDFPQISVTVPSDQQQILEGSDQLAAFELLLDKPAPRGGITVDFDLTNLTLTEAGSLRPTAQSGDSWQNVDFQVTTTIDGELTQTQDVTFGEGLNSSIYIPAGARKGIVYVNALDDQRAEGTQRIQLQLTGVDNADDSRYQVAGDEGTISIVDTDRPGVEILSLQSSFTYNAELDRAEEVNRLEQADRIIVRELDDGAMTLRFNLDDLLWDGQDYQTAEIEITDTAGLTLSETSLSLTDTQRFAVTTVTGDYNNKILSGILTVDGVPQSFSFDLIENQELTDAANLRLNPDAENLQTTFEQGHLLTSSGTAYPVRVRQSSWNEYVYVRLTSAPLETDQDVVVDLTATQSIVGTDEVLLSTDQLTFTAENWDQPQLVGIRGVNDNFNDPNQLGQILAAISVDPTETTDKAYEFGGDRASLLYLNVAVPTAPVEITNDELVQAYQPENPANPNYRFETNAQTRQLTITEGETAQVTIAADPSGQTGSLKGRYKVVEPGLTRALYLNGGDDRLTFEQPVDMGETFTLQLAFRWDGTRDQGQRIQLVDANGHGDVFIGTDGRLEAQFTNAQGATVTIQSDTPLLANEDYVINVVTDGLSTKFYADGQLIGSGSLGATPIAPVAVTSVFGADDTSQVDNFRGVVYGTRLWNRELSQSEIRRFAQASLNLAPVVFTLDEANNQVKVALNPELIDEPLTAPLELTFRRYTYTGNPDPEVSLVTVTFDANNWQATLDVPFNFNSTQSLRADIQQITVQIESQTDQVQNFISNVGDAYELELLRSQHLIDEISPTDLERFGRRANFAEDGAIQGLDYRRLEGVAVERGHSEALPLAGNRYLGDRPTVVAGDLTGDDTADLLVVTEKAGTQFYENTSTGNQVEFTLQDAHQPLVDRDIVGQGFSGSEARLVDVDGDDDLDLVWSQDGGLQVQLNQPADGVAFAESVAAIPLVDQTGSPLGSGQQGDLVGFDFADINQDGNLDAVVLDGNNQLQTYLGNSAFNLMDGLVRMTDETNPFRDVVLPEDQPLALKFGDVIVDGVPELYVYERDGGDDSYWRFLMPEADGSQDIIYRDRTFIDPLTSRAGQIGDLESLTFLNDSGVDSVFLSLENGHYTFGYVTERSNEIELDYSDPQAGAQAVLDIVSLQDNQVELDERVRLQLLSTDDLTTEAGMDRTLDVLIQDDDRPGVTLAYVADNGQTASIVASHQTPPDDAPRSLIEGEQSSGFYVLSLDSQPQENVRLILRNSDSERLQFERIHPLTLSINGDGSLTIDSRLADTSDDYSLRFTSPLIQSVNRDGQGAYQVQLQGDSALALQSAIANKSLSEIQQSATVQSLLQQVGIRVDSNNPTYRLGLGLNAHQLLQERVSVTPQEQLKLNLLPDGWNQQILLRPVAADNLVDNQQSAHPRLAIAIDSSDFVYSSLPTLVAEVPITDTDRADIIINQLDDIREGVDGGQFQVSLNSKPEGTVLITLEPGDINGDNTTALALDTKYYGDTIDLEFTQYNWNAPQTVKVRAQDDNLVTGDLQSYVHATVRSDDPNYAGMAVEPVTVTIRDNDLPSVSAYTVLDASEPGQIGFFGIRLNTDQVRNPEGLKIHYRVRGWASAPASADDYQEYVNLTPEGENYITIAPDQDLGNVVIFPIDDYIAEGFDVTFKPNDVETGSDRISIENHRLIEGSKVVFVTESDDGDIPEGLSDESFYYVRVINDNTVELYSDPNRTQKVNLTSGGVGETRLLDATGKATVEEAKENTKRFEAVELELLSDPNGTNPGYQLAPIDTQASVRIYDNEEVGFRFILPGQQVLDSSSPADKGYLTIAEHPDIDNTEEFSSAVFLVRPLSDPGQVQTGTNVGDDNWISLRFDPRWDQNSAQELQVHLAEEPSFEEDGTQTVNISVYDQYGRKIQFYQRDPEVDNGAGDELTDQLEIEVTKETWAEPIRLKSEVFFDLNGNGEWDAGEHKGVTLSDSRYDFGDDLSQLNVGLDEANFNVSLADFDVNDDGYLTLFETTLRSDQPAGWGIVSSLGNATAIAVQVGDDIGKVAIEGNTDVAVDRWNRFAVFSSFASDTADTDIKLVAEDGVPASTLLPSDYSGDPYASDDLWKQNSVYFDSNNWTRFQRVNLTALDDKEYDIDRILPLEMKVYENEGNDGFYSKRFTNAQSPLVLTVKDRRLDNETVTGSLANGFSKLEEIINNYEIPLVGSLSGKLPPFLTDFIRAFSRNLEEQRYITGPSLATALSDALNEQLDGTGVEVSIEYDADEQTIAMSLAFGQDYDLFEISLDSDLGLPALGLETEGSLASIFHFDLRVGIALNLNERTFTLDISEDEDGNTNTGADANVYLDLNNFKATGNIAFLKAELEQIPLDDFINGHKPQVTIWLDEEANTGEDEQTVTVRAYDIGGDEIDLDLTSGNTFVTYEKTEENWKHPIILEGLDYDSIDELSVDFNGSTRRFRVDWTGENDLQGLKVDARLFSQDPHAFFQEYDGEKDILGNLEKDAESESLLSKGDTHSEAALGVNFSLVGKKTVEVEIERKYAFAIETETEAQTIPTLYTGDKDDGSQALEDFLDDQGPQDGMVSITLEDIDNNSEDINLFTVELFKLVDPNRESFSASAEEDDDFFEGLKLEPINFTLGAVTVDPEDPQPEDPRLPLHRQLNVGGNNNSALMRDVSGYVINFTTGLESGNIETGSDVVFRVTKAQVSDGLPNGTFYYIQPFNEDKAIHQVVDYLVVNGPEPEAEGAAALEVSITNPDAAENDDKNELADLFVIQGDNITLSGAETQGSLSRLEIKNAEKFVVETVAAGTSEPSSEAAQDTYALTETGIPVREAEVGISELGSKAKELFDYTLNGSVGAAFNLVTSVAGNTSFPSLSLDLGVAAQAEKTKAEAADLSLTVGLKDLGLDLGSFITKFAAPVIEAVDSVFEPIKPFVEMLNQDTEFLEYLGLESQFDKDANGEVSTLELALVLSDLSRQRGEAKYAEFFETVVKVIDFIETIEKLSAQLEKGDNLVVPLLDEYHLSLTPGGDEEAGEAGNGETTTEKDTDLPKPATETSAIQHQETKPDLPGTDGIGEQAAESGNENASSFNTLIDKIQGIEGLKFPILDDPVSLVNLLFGKDVNLVLYEVPDLKLELNPRVEFTPFPAYPVKGVLEGRFEVGANLGFGYDTYGFRQWAEADFDLAESYQVFDGFFLTDWTIDSYLSSTDSGIDDKPELYATAEVEAGVEVGEGLTGYFGVGVGANVNFDLEDKGEYQDNIGTSDGKVRGSEIIAGISDPLSLFELYGRIYAFLKALVELDLGLFNVTLYEQKWEFDLFKFQIGGAKQSGAAVQSEIVGATVFFDANFNMKFDEGEPWGVTLGDGSYSFGIDPSEFDIDGDGQLTLMDGQIVVIGGRDKESGLPIINPMVAAPNSDIVSPLTTLATQIAVSNGGDLTAAADTVKTFFNLPDELDLDTFHPINAIRNGTAEEAALGLQVYQSHIVVDSLIYNISRVAGGYSETGMTADLVIEVVDFVAQQLSETAIDDSEDFEERLSNFTEDVVADFYEEEILPELSGNELTEAQAEQSTVITVLSDTYERVAATTVGTGGSVEEVQQAFENLTPLKTALKTDVPAALDQFQQGTLSAEEVTQQSQQTLSQVANKSPVVDSSRLFTSFNPYEGATVGSIFGPTFSDDAGDSFYGVAIVGHIPQINLGYWAYYDSEKALWFTLDQPITADNALVLEADTRLRFIPETSADGAPTPDLTVRLIDQNGQGADSTLKTGDRIDFEEIQTAGGISPYSDTLLNFTTTITLPESSMSNPPSLTQTIADIENLAFAWEDAIPEPQGATVASLFSQYFESGSIYNFYGIAIGDYKFSPSEGVWQYSTNDGDSWTDLSEINPDANDEQLMLRTSTLLRFLPTEDYEGPATALAVNLIDSRVGDGFTSGDTNNIAIDFPNSYTEPLHFQTQVYGVNDAPVSDLEVTFVQSEAIRISDRKSATTADPSPVSGKGDVFPSVITVDGLLGEIEDISLTLEGLNVTADNNLDIWLEGPQGQKIVLLSDAGNGVALNDFTITFNDGGVPALAGNSANLVNNTIYQPTNNTAGGADLDPSGFDTAATSFTQFMGEAGETLNGDWKLYIEDDTDSGVDAEKFGKLLDGWSLTFNRVEGSFSPIQEDSSTPQELTVADLFGSHFTDVDSDSLKGVAIINNAATAAEGQWQYWNGQSWSDVATVLTETEALLLSAATKIRFVPTPDFNGKPGAITGRLIDSSHPNFAVGQVQDARFTTSGGPFSQDTIGKTLTITPLNDAPAVVSDSAPIFPNFIEDTPFTTDNAPTVETVFGSSFRDSIDGGNLNQNTFIGIAIVQDFATINDNRQSDLAIAYEKGHWEVYDIRYGQWVALPSDLSENNAYLVPKTTQIRFNPSDHYNGELPPLTAYLVDNGAGQAVGLGQRIDLSATGVGGTTRYTSTTVTLNGEVEAVNDVQPGINNSSAIQLSEAGQNEDLTSPLPTKSVADLFGPRFADSLLGDADGSDGDQFGYNQEIHGIFNDAIFWGVVVKDVPASTVGTWEYSADGVTWQGVSGWSSGSGLYLPKSYQLRFRQTQEHYNDTRTGVDLGAAHPLVAYLVDGSVVDTSIGNQLENNDSAISAIATATPTPNRSGEVSPISASSLTLEQAIHAVNDAPTLPSMGNLLVDSLVVNSVVEDETNPIYVSGITIADVDANEVDPDGDLTVTLSVDHGRLIVNTAVLDGLNATQVSNNDSNTVTLSGKLAELNTTLAAATAVQYQDDTHFNGEVTLTATVNDNGNAGQGGEKTAESTRSIVIDPVNDSPTIVFDSLSSTLSADEDKTLYIDDIVINDVDAPYHPEGELEITLSVSQGTLTINPNIDDGLTNQDIAYNEDFTEATLTGTVAKIQATLQASKGLGYLGDDHFSGNDTLNITVKDNGNTGVGNPLESSTARAIVIDPVNDAPTVINDSYLPKILRNTLDATGETVSTLFGNQFDDSIDSGSMAGIAIVANAANPITEGNWQYSLDAGTSWQNVPIRSLSQTNAFTLTVSALLRFKPVADYIGKPGHLDVHLIDDSAIVANGELGINLAKTGDPTAYSEDAIALGIYVALSNTDQVDLTINEQQQLLVTVGDNEQLVQSQGTPIVVDQFPGWEIMAVDTIEGVNQILWKHKATNQVAVWRLEDNWEFESGEALDIESVQAFELETKFGVDLNDDSELGEGSPREIETEGTVDLLVDVFNTVLVEAGDDPQPIMNQGNPVVADQYRGWQAIAADTIEGVNQLLWKNETSQQVAIWRLNDNWEFESGDALDLDSKQVFELETDFGVDLNDDSQLGVGSPREIETEGTVDLLVDVFNTLLVDEGGDPQPIMNQGNPVVADQYPGWQAIAADTIEGANQLLWKNETSQQVALWRLNDNWEFESGDALDLDSKQVFELETDFG
ncbi:MAG: DUF4347 domain-containing protein, partial [Cyanobacteria bacterium P01_D01_bin.156]